MQTALFILFILVLLGLAWICIEQFIKMGKK